MPEQGPRPARRGEGRGGPVLRPVRRLAYAGAAVIIGGLIVAVGTRITWVRVDLGSGLVVRTTPGLPNAVLGSGEAGVDAFDLGGGYLFGLSLLLALIPLGWLVLGPRGRVILAVLGVAVALGIGAGVAVLQNDLDGRAVRATSADVVSGAFDAQVQTRWGPYLTAAGSIIGGLGAIVGGLAGRRLPRMGMPEPPDRGSTP